MGVARGVAYARRLLRAEKVSAVVSTGSGIALSFLPYAAISRSRALHRKRGARGEAFFDRADAAVDPRRLPLPSIPARGRRPLALWRIGLDGFRAVTVDARPVTRVVVTVGMERSFRRLIERVAHIFLLTLRCCGRPGRRRSRGSASMPARSLLRPASIRRCGTLMWWWRTRDAVRRWRRSAPAGTRCWSRAIRTTARSLMSTRSRSHAGWASRIWHWRARRTISRSPISRLPPRAPWFGRPIRRSSACARRHERLFDRSAEDGLWATTARHPFSSLFSSPLWIDALARTYDLRFSASARIENGVVAAAIRSATCRTSEASAWSACHSLTTATLWSRRSPTGRIWSSPFSLLAGRCRCAASPARFPRG